MVTKRLRGMALLFGVLIVTVMCWVGCYDEPTSLAPTGTQLSHGLTVRPGSVRIYSRDTLVHLIVSASADKNVVWEVTNMPEYACAEPIMGTCLAGHSCRIDLRCSLNDTMHERLVDTVTIQANNELFTVEILCSLKTSNDPLVFTNSSPRQSYSYSAASWNIRTVKVVAMPPWLLTDNQTVSLSGTQLKPLWFEVDTAYTCQMAPGRYEGTIVIESELGIESIRVELHLNSLQFAAIPPDGFYMVGPKDSFKISLQNKSDSLQTWSIPKTGALSISPASGTLSGDSSTILSVAFDGSGSKPMDTTLSLAVLSGIDTMTTLIVHVKNSAPEFGWLPTSMVAADYSESLDKIVVVPSDSQCVFVVDPIQKTMQRVATQYPGTCVAIDPSGKTAAIGHKWFVSLMDITTSSIIEVFSTNVEPIDIHYNSHSVYIVNGIGASVRLHCTNVENRHQFSTGSQYYGGAIGCLSAAGDALYVVNFGVSPQDAEKWMLGPDTAYFLYDSPYHGTYSFGGDLWALKDGKRIVSGSALVFRATPDQNSDMTFVQKIDTVSYMSITSFYDNAASGLCYAIDYYKAKQDTLAPDVKQFSNSNFSCTGDYTIPGLGMTDHVRYERLHPLPRYVFVNATGESVHIVATPRDRDYSHIVVGTVSRRDFN